MTTLIVSNEFDRSIEVIKIKGFIPGRKVCRSMKHKSDISVQLDLPKGRCDIPRETRIKIKHVYNVEYAFADICWCLDLRFKNGRFTFFNS